MRIAPTLLLLLTLLASLATLGACGRPAPPTAITVEEVARTTSPAVDELARRIGAQSVRVEAVYPHDALIDPWHPTPDEIARLQRARLIVSNGAGLEAWVQTASLPRSRLVESADSIEPPLIRVAGETHSHGPEGNHTHDVLLGQTWLDPLNAMAQATAIRDAMVLAFPEHRDGLTVNHAGLLDELQALHERISGVDATGIEIIAPETPYAYLARRYGWRITPIGPDPSSWSRDLHAMRLSSGPPRTNPAILLCPTLPPQGTQEAMLREHGVRCVLWTTGPLPSAGGTNIDRLESAMGLPLP